MKINTQQIKELKNRLDALELALNGGKGSGNWGHAGRKGKVGGSAPASVENPNITPQMKKVAKSNISKAKKEEPETTKALGEAFDNNGASFYGLDWKLKSEASLARKIASDIRKKGVDATKENIQEIASKIGDNLRYTAICNEKTYKKQYDGIMRDLKAKGFEVVKVKNTMKDKNAMYCGINTQLKNKNGYVFELQFHTPASQAVKDKNHVDYERYRKDDAPERLKEILGDRMLSRYSGMSMPSGANKIKDMDRRS